MKARGVYQVKDVARIAGISVRTLHHYDEIKLLVPQKRSRAGYRLYTDEDLLRLQQILIGRELGLSLEEIRRSLDDPRYDRKRALIAQREQLLARSRQTQALIQAVDAALTLLDTKRKSGGSMDMKKIFGGFDPSKYEEEAKQRWGHTDAYKESVKRAKSYTEEDWKRLQAEQAELYKDALDEMKSGGKPSDPKAMDIAERHRLSIDRWFYPCDYNMHKGLASLYESDSRFAENMDKHGAGITTFLVAAIRANAERNET